MFARARRPYLAPRARVASSRNQLGGQGTPSASETFDHDLVSASTRLEGSYDFALMKA